MKKILTEADVLIGHNICRFDIPVVEQLLGIKIKAKLVDTLALSWYLYPSRLKHGLEEWGEEVGVKKPEIDNWENLSQEEYENRCCEDVKINVAIWNKFYRYLMEIYGSDKEIWKLLDYLSFKMYCARLQEDSRWKLDVEYTEKAKAELEELQEQKVIELSKAMPQVPIIQIKSKPKVFINKDGSYSKHGMNWIALLTEKGLPPTYDGEVEIIKGYEEGNPNSTDQVKNWLYSLGWEPETFKTVKNKKTGESREVPQINLEHGAGICPSIKKLFPKEPNLELLEGLGVLQHRIGILNGFLRDNENGYLKAQISGFTNTLRVKHKTIVNLPKVNLLYAKAVRGSLIADEGFELCGSDMSALEDKLKQHYIYPLDPEYVKEMQKEGYDPHLSLALSDGAITEIQMEEYTSGISKVIKPVRDTYKTVNYSAQYGAGGPRIAKAAGTEVAKGYALHKAYWSKNWAIKEVARRQRVKTVNDQMWLFNPVSELWYSLRFEKDIFSTLVQGTASYVFDMWIKFIFEEREQLTGQFHDEIILQIRKGFRKECERLVRKSLDKLNDMVQLNVKLAIDVQFGDRYASIH